MPVAVSVKLSAVVLVTLLLSACGFQLRGQAELPSAISVTYIDSNTPPDTPPGELARTLKFALRNNGVTVTDEPTAATATIDILSERQTRRTLATGPDGEIREYTLTYAVDYAVSLADGSALVPKDTLRISRDVLYNEAQVLGRAAGEKIVMRDMVADAAYSIIRRLQAIGG